MIAGDKGIRWPSKLAQKSRRCLNSTDNRLSAIAQDIVDWLKDVDHAGAVICTREFAGGGVNRSAEFLGQFHRRLDFQRRICGAARVSISLEQSKSGEVVGLALKLIGDVRRQCFLALLKQAKQLAVRGDLVMAGFVELQKILLRLDDGIVDMDHPFTGVIESKHLRNG